MNNYEEIGIEVYEQAQAIFADCKAENDFCHQTGLVFGGTNRIKLTSRGWIAEPEYCTPLFLMNFKRLMRQSDYEN
jgi:hypothetical protein